MRPKAKTDIRPQPKPTVAIRPQQVMAMLGVLLMFAMALSWLWQPIERETPPPTQEVIKDSLQQTALPLTEPISMRLREPIPR